jgi:hypothetical protein
MERTPRTVCPHCRATLTSPKGLRVGKTIQCPQCASSFTVQPAESAPAAAVSAAAPQQVGTSGSRLAIVLLGALLYLGGGAALAAYCFHLNAQHDSDPTGVARTTEQEPPAPPAPPEPPPRGAGSSVPVSTAEQRQIDDAIVKGVWFLRARAQPTGTWDAAAGGPVRVGLAALPALTLLECGVAENDPVITRAANYVRAQAPGINTHPDTYQRSLAILFLDRLGNPKDKELIQYLALCLIAAQRPDDFGWGYPCPHFDRNETARLLTSLRDEKLTLDQWREEALKEMRYDPGPADNSNTQFAILALWVARRHGVPIERTIERVEKRFLEMQMLKEKGAIPDLDGCWTYKANQFSASKQGWPTMTCAGLLGLAVAKGLAAEKEGTKDKGADERNDRIRRGLAMLGRSIDKAGETRGMDLYFLWSLERVGVLFNLDKIDGKDWFAWGRKPILERQQGDGRWQTDGYWGSLPVVDTCFALLFLQQANLAADLTDKLRLLAGK